MTYAGVVSAARSRASSISSLVKPSAFRKRWTWASPSASTLPGPSAMTVLRNTHDASRLAGLSHHEHPGRETHSEIETVAWSPTRANGQFYGNSPRSRYRHPSLAGHAHQ